MAAASPLARSLLLLVCFALLTACASRKNHKHHPEHFDHHILPNCAQYSEGTITQDVIVLPTINTPPYKSPYQIHNKDLCGSHKKLVGFSIVVCDPLGPPGPSFKVYNNLKLSVKCYTYGPCPSGLTVKVSQYCSWH